MDGSSEIPELSIVTDDNSYILPPEKIMEAIAGNHTKTSTTTPGSASKPVKESTIQTKQLSDEYFPIDIKHPRHAVTGGVVTKKTQILDLPLNQVDNDTSTVLDAIQLLGENNEKYEENVNKSLSLIHI